MNSKKYLSISVTILTATTLLVATPLQMAPAYAADSQKNQSQQTEELEQEPVSCDYSNPEKAVYGAKYIAVRKKGALAKNEVFETKIYIQNTGNVPWFSADSGCQTSIVSLGTDKARDRESAFFTDALIWESNWTGANRIKMETPRVDPQQMAVFTFWSSSPDKDGLYREYFTPVVEGVTWIDTGIFYIDIKIGDPNIDPATREYFTYIDRSTNLAEIDLSGEKNIEVDLSEQKMWLKIGDNTIKEFRVSTGKASTPTPVGTTKILNKQEVRVSAAAPHYIMPKWMMFRKGGFGIHALPSLGNDRGVFWREALSHIGSPRSHGCIRLLPKDAEFAYNFASVGTTVVVHR